MAECRQEGIGGAGVIYILAAEQTCRDFSSLMLLDRQFQDFGAAGSILLVASVICAFTAIRKKSRVACAAPARNSAARDSGESTSSFALFEAKKHNRRRSLQRMLQDNELQALDCGSHMTYVTTVFRFDDASMHTIIKKHLGASLLPSIQAGLFKQCDQEPPREPKASGTDTRSVKRMMSGQSQCRTA